jgi:hypothetical protein
LCVAFPNASRPLGYAEGETSIIIKSVQRTGETAVVPNAVVKAEGWGGSAPAAEHEAFGYYLTLISLSTSRTL